VSVPPIVAVLGQSLALLGCAGGIAAGLYAGCREPRLVPFWSAFLVYLGVMSAVVATWAGSLEIVPLALVLGAAAGILPFAALFLLCRRLVRSARASLNRRRPSNP
jgi:hypothetical protein